MKTKNFKANQKASQCAVYSKIVAFYNAKGCYNEAVTFTTKLMDFTDDNTPTILKIEVCINSATALANKNNFVKAKMLINTALTMAREDFGEKSMTYANALVASAGFLHPKKRNEALASALKIIETKKGAESVEVATILSAIAFNHYRIQHDTPATLGSLLKDAVRDKYREASKQAEKALVILTRQLGSDNILTAGPKSTLAAIKLDNANSEASERMKTNLLKEVEKLFTENVDVCKAVLGEFNPRTAGQMTNLGLTYQLMGKISETEQLLTMTLEVQTAMLGPDHNDVATCHNRLAVLYDESMGQYKKAEEHYMKAICILEKLFGPAHSLLQFQYNGLIDLYRKTGDDAKKKKFEEKKREWVKLQKETKKETGETGEKEKEGTMKDFMHIINYV